MDADYNVQLLLGVMECTTTEVDADVFLPPKIMPFCSMWALSFTFAFSSSLGFNIYSDAHNATD